MITHTFALLLDVARELSYYLSNAAIVCSVSEVFISQDNKHTHAPTHTACMNTQAHTKSPHTHLLTYWLTPTRTTRYICTYSMYRNLCRMTRMSLLWQKTECPDTVVCCNSLLQLRLPCSNHVALVVTSSWSHKIFL